MGLLITGVLVWTLVHWFPALMPGAREGLIARFNKNLYRGSFALIILSSIVLIVIGWRTTNIQPVYVPPFYGGIVMPVLMLASFVLFAAAEFPGNLRRLVRHPMLLGAATWGIAHLLANGDNRSVVLFGGISVWSLVSIVLINRRDGTWTPPPPAPLAKDLLSAVLALVIFGVVIFLHRLVIGVSALPGF